ISWSQVQVLVGPPISLSRLPLVLALRAVVLTTAATHALFSISAAAARRHTHLRHNPSRKYWVITSGQWPARGIEPCQDISRIAGLSLSNRGYLISPLGT